LPESFISAPCRRRFEVSHQPTDGGESASDKREKAVAFRIVEIVAIAAIFQMFCCFVERRFRVRKEMVEFGWREA
jgi:hypothetical protein